MKKLIAILLIVLSFSLISCKKDDGIVALVDNPNTTVIEELGLADITVSLNSELDTTSGSYVDIKVAENIANSLIVRNVNFDKFFKDNRNKVQSIGIGAITFVSGLSDEYKLLIEKELTNSTYGITHEKAGLTEDTFFSPKFKSTISVEKGTALYENEYTDITCSVIYLPIRALIYKDSQNVLSVYVFIPVYAEFGIYKDSDHSIDLFENYTEAKYSVNSNNVFVIE